MLSIGLIVLIAAVYALSSIKILSENERGVVFRLGRLLPETKGPGLVFVPAAIDRMVRVSLLNETHELPPQEVVTADEYPVTLQPVITLQVTDPQRALAAAGDYRQQISNLAQTALKSAVGELKADDVADRSEVIRRMQAILDRSSESWGVKVSVALKE